MDVVDKTAPIRTFVATKRRSDSAAAPSLVQNKPPSEHQLQRKLHLAGRSHRVIDNADGWIERRTAGSRGLACARGAGDENTSVSRHREIRVIENIKEFGAELSADLLGNSGVFDDAKIGGKRTRPPSRISSW